MPSANAFPSQITIGRKVTTDDHGGQIVNYTATYKNTPALVTDASATLQLIYMQRDIKISHVIYLNKVISINTGDLIQFGTRKFFIRGLLDVSGTGRIFQIMAEEVQNSLLVVED